LTYESIQKTRAFTVPEKFEFLIFKIQVSKSFEIDKSPEFD